MTWRRVFAIYTISFIFFVIALGVAEQFGLSQRAIGYTFMGVTIGIYALIGILSRTKNIAEYYVAGRSVPSFFNGMATGSDWMSAASFIGMAGTIYALGYGGLAYIMGWTGGYVLLAVFLAPYLRKFGEYTIPDFLGARFGGNTARSIGLFCAILVSFTYLIAQVTGVGIIMSRFLGIPFGIGVFVGLAGILVCSMLGGMRAVTWTQVAQYIILILAYLTPVVVMSYRQTGVPVPQLAYGTVLQRMAEREKVVYNDPKDIEVRGLLAERAKGIRADIAGLPASLDAKRADLQAKVAAAPDEATRARLQTQLEALPANPDAAREAWTASAAATEAKSKPPAPYMKPPEGLGMLNFLALTLCLMVGTAGLPHILMRYYTTPSVRQARASVAWSLFFIFLLYFTAPAYAAFARNNVMNNLTGSLFSNLPAWVANWSKVGLVSVTDVNMDGTVQWSEITLQPDAIVLATPEIAGLPYVIAGLVAAGGLAAALSTADGLLLTISNALSHDLYFKQINPHASVTRRLTISRILLVVAALGASYAATYRLTIIVEIVAWAFSLAAAIFFPALVMGVWWRRATSQGAIAGMLTGLVVCLFYMIGNRFYGVEWLGIKSVASAFYGMPANFLVLIVVSLLTPAPDEKLQDFIYSVRFPRGAVKGQVAH